MALKNALLLLVAVCVLAAGCAKPEEKYVGQYTGKLEFTPEAQARLERMSGQAGALKAVMDQMKMTLDLRKDMSYTMAATVMGKATSATGTWAYKDDKLTLTPTQATGPTGQQTPIGAGKAQAFTPSADGKTLTVERPGGNAEAKMIFTRN